MPSKSSRVAVSWLKRLLDRKANPRATLAQAKSLAPHDLEDLLSRAARVPAIASIIGSAGFPTLEQLGLPVEGPLLGELEDELNWAIAILHTQTEGLQALLPKKLAFENCIFADDLPSARLKLDEIVESHGWSLWAVEARLLIAQLQLGNDGCQRELAELLEHNSAFSVRLFGLFTANRLADDAAATQHDRAVSAFIASLKEEDEAPEQHAHYYHYIRALVAFPSIRRWTRDGLGYVLSYFEQYSALDRYLFTQKALQLCVTQRDLLPKHQVLLKHVQRFASIASSLEAQQMVGFLVPGQLQPALVQDALIDAADRYTEGDYSGAASSCAHALDARPDAIEYAELYARSISLGADPTSHALRSKLARRLCQNLSPVLLRTATFPTATQELLSVAYRYLCTPLGLRLLALVLSESDIDHVLGARSFRLVTSSAISARSSTAHSTYELSRTFLKRLDSMRPESTSVLLFRSAFGEVLPAHLLPLLAHRIPEIRRQRYSALAAEAEQRNAEAIAHLQHVVAAAPRASTMWLDANLDLLRVLQTSGECELACVTAADFYMVTPRGLNKKNLQWLASNPPPSEGSVDAHVSYAILVYELQKVTRSALDSSELYPLVENVLHTLGVAKPSETPTDKIPFLPKLVYFLNNICAPDVLDWSLEYSDSHSLDAERNAICRLLQRLDKENVGAYAEEIDRRAKAAAIQKVMQVASLSKVHVDTDGIRRSLGGDFHDGVRELEMAQAIERDLKRYVGAWLRDSTRHRQRDRRLIITDSQIARALGRSLYIFKRLFDLVKERFIASDEYGLDSYLSVRIRHGTLSGQLRGTFERRALVTKRSGSNGEYTSNDRWLKTAPPSVHNDAQHLLAGFSQRVDQIVERLKGDWVQVRSKGHPEGLFDFRYTSGQTVDLYNRLAGVTDPEELIAAMFEELWTRTESCLVALRQAIATDVTADFMGALDKLDAGVRSLGNGKETAPLLNTIANSRTEIQYELNVVAAWFAISDTGALADYDLGVALDAAIETVRRNQSPTFQASTSIRVPGLLRGPTLPYVFDICHIVLENIVRHSGHDPPTAKVSITTQDGRLVLHISNPIPSWVNEADFRKTVRNLGQRATTVLLDGVKTEGGSGYRKLGKILRHDLGCLDARVDVDVSDHEFQVVIGLDFGLLRASA